MELRKDNYMNDKTFTKLSSLVDQDFTIVKVWGYKFKMWDETENKMLSSDVYVQGYRKVYGVDTDKGSLDLSASQFSQMLEGVNKQGVADVNGRTFHVKSNGKAGKDIRYWLNPTKSAPVKTQDTVAPVDDEPINLDELGW